jgi:hypothetical protein
MVSSTPDAMQTGIFAELEHTEEQSYARELPHLAPHVRSDRDIPICLRAYGYSQTWPRIFCGDLVPYWNMTKACGRYISQMLDPEPWIHDSLDPGLCGSRTPWIQDPGFTTLRIQNKSTQGWFSRLISKHVLKSLERP